MARCFHSNTIVVWCACAAVLAACASAPIASAAGVKFFEFAPDISRGLGIVGVEIPSQPFHPYNDVVSGFDVWVENLGAAGEASFGLRDENDVLLASQTVTVPTIARRWGGTMVHVDFPVPIVVQSDARYKIRMVSSMPQLKVYYADQIQLLQHNAVYLPAENILEAARLGTVEQPYYFKIALYEDNDQADPVITNVTTTIIDARTARVSFNVNEPADWRLSVTSAQGTDIVREYADSYMFCNEGIALCLTDVPIAAGTFYHFVLTVRDSWNNDAVAEGDFITEAEPAPALPPPLPPQSPLPSVPPQLSNARIVALSQTSATFVWTTDKAATSDLLISRDAAGINIVTVVHDGTFELEHTLATGAALSAGTTYFAVVASADPGGLVSRQQISFSTLLSAPSQPPPQTPPPPQPPLPPAPQPPATQPLLSQPPAAQPPAQSGSVSVSVGGNGNVMLSWSSLPEGEPADGYRIDIFSSEYELARRLLTAGGQRAITIEGLAPGEYYAVVYASENGVYRKVGEVMIIRVPALNPSFFNRYGTAIIGGGLLLLALAVVLMRGKKTKHL